MQIKTVYEEQHTIACVWFLCNKFLKCFKKIIVGSDLPTNILVFLIS